jgi:hypothetical protein
VTRNRPQSLRRRLESFTAACGAWGRETGLAVFDDSTDPASNAAVREAATSLAGVALFSGYNPESLWCFADLDSAVAFAAPADADILAAHEELLGRTPRQCVAPGFNHTAPAAYRQQLSHQLFDSVMRGAGRVMEAVFQRLHPPGTFGHVPYALLHEPPEVRIGDPDSVWQAAVRFEMANLVMTIVGSFETPPHQGAQDCHHRGGQGLGAQLGPALRRAADRVAGHALRRAQAPQNGISIAQAV